MSRTKDRSKWTDQSGWERPRNPLVLPARQRRAGAHQTDPGGKRSAVRASLRRWMQDPLADEPDDIGQ